MDITVRQDESFELPITIDDGSAVTAQLKVWGNTEIINETATFVGGEATIDAGIITADVGTYNYSVTIVYSDGKIDILPDVTDCTSCEFPTFEICPGGQEAS